MGIISTYMMLSGTPRAVPGGASPVPASLVKEPNSPRNCRKCCTPMSRSVLLPSVTIWFRSPPRSACTTRHLRPRRLSMACSSSVRAASRSSVRGRILSRCEGPTAASSPSGPAPAPASPAKETSAFEAVGTSPNDDIAQCVRLGLVPINFKMNSHNETQILLVSGIQFLQVRLTGSYWARFCPNLCSVPVQCSSRTVKLSHCNVLALLFLNCIRLLPE